MSYESMMMEGRCREPNKKTYCILNTSQEMQIRRFMLDKIPSQLGFKCALWTQEVVRQLIRLKYAIDMPTSSVIDYLQRWGFAPQNPLRQAYEQNPWGIKKWLYEEYPEIVRRAKAENAEIHWCDEVGSSCAYSHHQGMPWGESVQGVCEKTQSFKVLSSMTHQESVRYMPYMGSMTGDLLREFLCRLIDDVGHRVFLIWNDGFTLFHNRNIKTWLDEREGEVEIFCLPDYIRGLNPDKNHYGGING